MSADLEPVVGLSVVMTLGAAFTVRVIRMVHGEILAREDRPVLRWVSAAAQATVVVYCLVVLRLVLLPWDWGWALVGGALLAVLAACEIPLQLAGRRQDRLLTGSVPARSSDAAVSVQASGSASRSRRAVSSARRSSGPWVAASCSRRRSRSA